MKAREAIVVVKEHLDGLTPLKLHNVIGVRKEKENWVVTLELVEKKSIPDAMDIFGIYEATIDEKGEMMNFERKSMRRRGDATKEGG